MAWLPQEQPTIPLLIDSCSPMQLARQPLVIPEVLLPGRSADQLIPDENADIRDRSISRALLIRIRVLRLFRATPPTRTPGRVQPLVRKPTQMRVAGT